MTIAPQELATRCVDEVCMTQHEQDGLDKIRTGQFNQSENLGHSLMLLAELIHRMISPSAKVNQP